MNRLQKELKIDKILLRKKDSNSRENENLFCYFHYLLYSQLFLWLFLLTGVKNFKGLSWVSKAFM